MKMKATTIFSFLLLNVYPTYSFNYYLIFDVMQWKNLSTILLITCDLQFRVNNKNTIDYLQSNNIWINHYDISSQEGVFDLNYQHFFVRLSGNYLVAIDLECNCTENLLNELSKRTLFHFERSWLVFGSTTEQIINVLGKENINVDADVMSAVPFGENLQKYHINDAYNPSHNRHGQFKVTNVGTWSIQTRLKMTATQTKFEIRRDFGGVKFLAVITVIETLRIHIDFYLFPAIEEQIVDFWFGSSNFQIPTLSKNITFLEHIDSNEDPQLDSMNRNMYRVFQLMSEMYNFKMAIRRAKIWGFLQPNGTWKGAIGLLNRSEVDISISGFRWENERYEAYDQTTDAYYVHLTFIFRHPKRVSTSNVFLTPFDMLVWLIILTVGIACSLTANYLFSVENKFGKIVHSLEHKFNETSFANGFLMVFGMFFQQGYGGNSFLISSRILTTTVLMLSICIYQFYSSSIVVSLLTEPPKNIRTVKQLLDSKMPVAVDDLPYIIDNFKRVQEESAMKLYNRVMTEPNPLMPLYEGLRMVKKGSFAFHTDGSSSYALLKYLLNDQELCELQEVSYMPVLPTHPGVPKKSPLKEIVKIGIRKIYETGLLAYHWKVWIAQLPKCEHSHIDVAPIDLTHLSSALYILVFGIHCSVCIFIGELVLNSVKNWWKLSKQTETQYCG